MSEVWSENAAALYEALSAYTRQRDSDDLAQALLAAGVPAAPLLHPKELAGYPHYKARGLYQMVPHPVLPDVPVYRLPWQIDGAAIDIERRCPLLGEHNDYVLREILGLSHAEVEAYAAAGAFEA